MKYKKLILLLLLAALLLMSSGCGENKESGASKASATMEPIFAMYNKVQLEQTKDQVDTELAVSGEENSNVPNTYYYVDSATGFGVSVLYDNSNKAIGKTVIYNSHKDIAPFCKKSVSKEQTDKIESGMTYDQVNEVLGGEGIEISQTEISFEDNKLSVIRRWANSDGSCLDVYFGTDGNVNNASFFENN